MLVNAYAKKIFNLAYQFTGTYEDAEDMTQEIFLKLYGSLKKYDFEKNFSAWLLTLAKNHLIDSYRRTKWEKKGREEFGHHLLLLDASQGPENQTIREESKRVIWESLNELSPEIRMCLILREIQGKEYEEIAEIMNLPLGTIKSRINRGRLRLAEILKQKRENKDGL